MFPRVWLWRCALVAFLALGIISYQLDLYDGLFSRTLSLFGSSSCSDEVDSYIILANISDTASKHARCGSGECGAVLAITGDQLGGRYMGLGNQMFVYASLYGIGRSIGADLIAGCRRTPRLKALSEFASMSADGSRRLSSVVKERTAVMKTIHSAEGKCCVYANVTANALESRSSYDLVSIGGYLQSWKYFDRFRRDVVNRLFEFEPSAAREAANHFANLIGDKATAKTYYACVHSRRGDLLSRSTRAQGYVYSDRKTVGAAIRFLNRTLAREREDFKILLFSDDPAWCFREFGRAVSIAGKQSAVVALRMMSEYCDALILTSSTSTFGWWASYLSKRGAKVYYNARVTEPGSNLENQIRNEDYFLPAWTPVHLEE